MHERHNKGADPVSIPAYGEKFSMVKSDEDLGFKSCSYKFQLSSNFLSKSIIAGSQSRRKS
jgi:hypothetical protein